VPYPGFCVTLILIFSKKLSLSFSGGEVKNTRFPSLILLDQLGGYFAVNFPAVSVNWFQFLVSCARDLKGISNKDETKNNPMFKKYFFKDTAKSL
jgi:hypothetical protein